MAAPRKKDMTAARKPAALKKSARNLIEQGQLVEAKQVLRQYMEKKPDDLENYTMTGVILILEGKLEEAEKVLLEGIRRDPADCDLLFNLGYVDEQRREYISALDLYRRAELAVTAGQQQEDIRAAVQRVVKKIKGKMVIGEDGYAIILEGNKEPLQLDYELNCLLEQKEILDAVVENLDPRAKTALVMGCEEWVIPKNLAELGLRVKAYASDVRAILKAKGVEFLERVRQAGAAAAQVQYYQLRVDEEKMGQLPASDMVLLLTGNFDRDGERKGGTAGRMVAALARKARRQLFVHVPGGAGQEGRAAGLDEALQQAGGPGRTGPVICWSGEDGSCLYRLDTARNVKKDAAALIPRGLEAVGSRTAVFEVETAKCRDLNGMAYTEEGWNHFTALLRQLRENPGLTYGDSVLKTYFDRFTPRNRQEQLFGAGGPPLSPLSEGWTLLPWMEAEGVKLNDRERPHSRPGGNHHFGPNTKEFGEREFKMIRDTFAMLRRRGYLPEVFPDGYIQGYFLKNGDDYRFMVSEGQHRMAALGVLGYDVIKCKHNPYYARVVDIQKINQWPQVQSDLYIRELAEKVFLYYFESDGRKKAEGLGLL